MALTLGQVKAKGARYGTWYVWDDIALSNLSEGCSSANDALKEAGVLLVRSDFISKAIWLLDRAMCGSIFAAPQTTWYARQKTFFGNYDKELESLRNLFKQRKRNK